MVVEDLHDLGLLDAGHALGLLGVVDEHDATPPRVDQVGPGHEADRPPALVDGDRRAVVDVLDVIGDVDDEIVRTHRERIPGPSTRARVRRA